jgi:hypothetical protein
MTAYLKGALSFHQLPLLAPQAALFLFAFISTLWSGAMLVSAGQVIYSIYGMLMAMCISSILSKGVGSRASRTELFVYLWIFLILIDYAVDWGFGLVQDGRKIPTIDEIALISICLLLILKAFGFRGVFSKTLLIYCYIFGQSFSALASGIIPLYGYFGAKYGALIKGIFLVLAPLACSLLFYLVHQNYITLYGKSIEFFISGSGRFQVWEALLGWIADRPLIYNIFGQGFMSERVYLSQFDLPWIIDCHNNVIQVLYGLGSIGLLLLINVWYQLHCTIKRLFISGRIDSLVFKVLVGCNLSFIAFGLTSSHYFSRPSVSAIFFTSLILLLNEKERVADAYGRLKPNSKVAE